MKLRWMPIFFLLLSVVRGLPLAAAEDLQDHAAWWKKNKGVVKAEEDPLAARAEEIFERVRAVADKKGSRFPELLILKLDHDPPWARATRDGYILLPRSALRFCFKDVPTGIGEARLAYVLGHELAHQANDDFWHAEAFFAVSEFGGKEKEKLRQLLKETADVPGAENSAAETKMKELGADRLGFLYMTMAGYDPKVILDYQGKSFFAQWVGNVTAKDLTHPSPPERAEFLLAQMKAVAEEVELFHFGIRLYQLGRYEEAVSAFESFKEKFPGRELFNNLGLCYYQMAMRVLAECSQEEAFRFALPLLIDTDTPAARLKGADSSCHRNSVFRKYLARAIQALEKAAAMDARYLPARVNLASALIMNEEYAKAIGASSEALRSAGKDPAARTINAVAMYLFDRQNGHARADGSLKKLQAVVTDHPEYWPAHFCLGTIEKEKGKADAARKHWEKAAALAPDVPYGAVLRQFLDLKRPTPLKTSTAKPVSPFPLGRISKEGAARLKNMAKKNYDFGVSYGSIYGDDRLKVFEKEGAIDCVEEKLSQPLTGREVAKRYGKPVRTAPFQGGNLLVYGDFAYEIRDDKAERVIFFQQQI